jgi:hypothetical protein
MKTTITRRYDKNGQLIETTVTEERETAPWELQPTPRYVPVPYASWPLIPPLIIISSNAVNCIDVPCVTITQ